MNPYTQREVQYEQATPAETSLTATLPFTLQGFSAEEIASLLLLRQWCQNGEAVSLSSLRRLEFLRLLVKKGTIEL